MIKNFLALFFGLLLCLLFMEFLFRLFAWAYTPQAQKPDSSAYRILCIGDSSTFGFGMRAPEQESYPAQLEKILKEHNQKPVQVLNCGLPGINSSQALHIFKSRVEKIKPDLVLVCAGVNDPWNLISSRVLELYEDSFMKRIFLKGLYNLERLKLFRFIYLNWITFQKNKDEAKEPVPDFDNKTVDQNQKLMPDPEKFQKALEENWRRNFLEFLKVSQEQECPLYFLEYHNEGWLEPVKKIHSLYAQLDLPVIPLFSLFQSLDERNLPVRGEDLWHPNALGYTLMAKAVLKALKGKIPLIIPEMEDDFGANISKDLTKQAHLEKMPEDE